VSAPNPAQDALIKGACQAAGVSAYQGDFDSVKGVLEVKLIGADDKQTNNVYTYLRQWVPAHIYVLVSKVAVQPPTTMNGYGGFIWYPVPNTHPAPAPPEAEEKEPETDPAPQLNTAERLAATRSDGMCCYRCGEWAPMASPNRRDVANTKDLFECFQCTQDSFRPGTRRRE